MRSEFFSEHLAASPVISILRGHSIARTVELARRCWDSGIRLVEVPTQSDAALAALAAAAEFADGDTRLIGAGTICSPRDVGRAHDAGASFMVAPGIFPEAVAAADDLGLPTLPGASTPTEVYTALELSLTVQKLFPATAHGPAGLRAMLGPFPQVQFVAVGGVDTANAQSYLDAGAAGIGVGAALDPESLSRFAALQRPR